MTIDMMPRVLLLLGEGRMLMPAEEKYPAHLRGPGLGLPGTCRCRPTRRRQNSDAASG